MAFDEEVIHIRIDSSQLEQPLINAQTEVKGFADVGADAFDRTARSVGMFAVSVQNAKASIRKLTGAIAAVGAAVGVFTLFYNIGTKLAAAMETGAERAEAFSNAIRSFAASEAKQRVKTYEDEIDKLNKKIAEATTSIGTLFGVEIVKDSPGLDKLQQQLADTMKNAAIARQQVTAQGIRNEEEASAKKAAALAAESAAASDAAEADLAETITRQDLALAEQRGRDADARRKDRERAAADAKREFDERAANEKRVLKQFNDWTRRNTEEQRRLNEEMRRGYGIADNVLRNAGRGATMEAILRRVGRR